MKLRLVSNRPFSSSLKRLAEGLSTAVGYKVFRSKLPKPKRVNIKYGDCKDKIFQYTWFKEQNLPALDFTTQIETAKEWAKTRTVFCRLLTRASEGKGIVIAETPEQVVLAPVYTAYKKKKKEFRVHVFQQNVISVLEKRKRKDFNAENRDTRIRNTANGYVFCRDDVIEPVDLRELALAARKVTASDFAGVDIGYNEKLNELFVIEVNSAPGIEGSNVDAYVKEITNAL